MSIGIANAWAQPRIGDTDQALPGIRRVPVIASGLTGLHTAIDAGYGLTEGQRGEGLHHRALGSLAVGLVALPGLEFGAMTTLRYDRHPNDGLGTDSGSIGQFAIVSRYGTRVSRTFGLGLDLGMLFPGTEKPADTLSSPAIDARALVAWLPQSGLRVAAFAGYRFDYTNGVGGNAPRYRTGDRLALGLSDFDSVLWGIGSAIPIGNYEFLGELSADLMVGHASPSLSKSPWRADIGIRRWFSASVQAELLSEYALSSRPVVSPATPLVPIEPRVTVMLGLRYQFTHNRATNSVAPPPTIVAAPEPQPAENREAPKQTPQAVPPATGHLVVTVFDHEGHPLSDATVELVTETGTRQLQFKAGSTFELKDAPVGVAKIAAKADLMSDFSRNIEIQKDGELQLRIDMLSAEVSGQIRGQVRAYNGRQLAAHVLIEPGKLEAHAGPDGTFSVDVSPGKYIVKIWLDGFQPQERSVQVGKRGVMVLNVDLQKGK